MNCKGTAYILPIMILFLLTRPALPVENSPEKAKVKKAKTNYNMTYYHDSRGFKTLEFLTFTNDIPGGFNLFGFTNFHGTQKSSAFDFDLTTHFIEYRLRRPVPKEHFFGISGISGEIEYNDFTGADNNVLRIGVTYKMTLPFLKGSFLQLRALPYETDGSGSFAGLVFGLRFGEKAFLSGFYDLHINKDTPNRIVSEAEVGYQIFHQFRLVMEARYNGFEDANPLLDGTGVAFGVKFLP